MIRSDKKPHAVVVLPFPMTEESCSGKHRWLARARFTQMPAGGERLMQLLAALEIRPPSGGLAALRLWGQTGTRPVGWLAAADPVFLEARLHSLVLHPLPDAELPASDVRAVFEQLEDVAASHPGCRFSAAGSSGYLHCDRPLATASASPAVAGGDMPAAFMPRGGAAAGERLQSEVQMSLHECDLNRRRIEGGMRPINALWIWGGGEAPRPSPSDLPPLYSIDPLMRGYWLSRQAEARSWPDELEHCLTDSPGGFVAAPPLLADPEDDRDALLDAVRHLLTDSAIRSLTLLFDNGLRADTGRLDRLRWWRRRPSLPGKVPPLDPPLDPRLDPRSGPCSKS